MLKEFLNQKEISIYKLSHMTEIPYSTINDMVNRKVDIRNIRAGIVYTLAKSLEISMDELYRLCENEIQVFSRRYTAKGSVYVRNKKYMLRFQYQDKEYISELYPVKKEATMFIESIALWQMEKLISDYEMEKLYELCIEAKR